MATKGPKRPALLAQWSRAPIPADVAQPSAARRERFVGAMADAMRRPRPRRALWRLRFRRAGLGVAAVACLLLLAVGTGLARTPGRSLFAHVSGLLRAWDLGIPWGAPRPPGDRPLRPETSVCAPSQAAPASPSIDVADAVPEPPPPPVLREAPGTRSRRASDRPLSRTAELAEQNRLFARAMTARRRGDAAEALRALDEFIRTYPEAPLAQDARVEQFRSLVEVGDLVAASGAARTYLDRYPNGFAQDEARALVLQRAR
jgi:hypothetical protein